MTHTPLCGFARYPPRPSRSAPGRRGSTGHGPDGGRGARGSVTASHRPKATPLALWAPPWPPRTEAGDLPGRERLWFGFLNLEGTRARALAHAVSRTSASACSSHRPALSRHRGAKLLGLCGPHREPHATHRRRSSTATENWVSREPRDHSAAISHLTPALK